MGGVWQGGGVLHGGWGMASLLEYCKVDGYGKVGRVLQGG